MYLTNFFDEKIREKKVIITDEADQTGIINFWAKHISEVHRKGLIPLIITGSGISYTAKPNDSNKNEINNGIPFIPGIDNIVYELHKGFNILEGSSIEKNKDVQGALIQCTLEANNISTSDRDRSMFSKIFQAFQSRPTLRSIWKNCTEDLLKKILEAEPTLFHKKVAELYRDYDAMCMTMNFDGLLVRELQEKGNSSFCLHTPQDCEAFLTRKNVVSKDKRSEFGEIQLRGDILFMRCINEQFCTQKGKEIPFIHQLMKILGKVQEEKGSLNKKELGGDVLLKELLKCPVCHKDMLPSLSFPGSYDKEREIKNMLSIVWKYLSYKIGCVTVAGLSGNWDPLIIGFLGDLLSERDVRLLVIEPNTDNLRAKDIIQELVLTCAHKAVALSMTSDAFADKLELSDDTTDKLVDQFVERPPDHYWDSEVKWREATLDDWNSIEMEILSTKAMRKLRFSSQLGLKSHWLSSRYKEGTPIKDHNRVAHSIGVTKIASYIYKKLLPDKKTNNPNEWRFLRLAALLHDIGHLPFSHLIEEVFNDLNWVPADYNDHYSHILQTESKIKDIFENDDKGHLKNYLHSLGYSISDLIRLINGNFGVPYLDAITNSALDADKIDYIFRDSHCTDTNISMIPKEFLNDIVRSTVITPEGFLAFSKKSAIAVKELLMTRNKLYNELYFTKPFRILDSITKAIITTFFVHTLDLTDSSTWDEIIDKRRNRNVSFADYGYYKILFSIRSILQIVSVYEKEYQETGYVDRGLEFFILKRMFNTIKESTKVSKNFIQNLQNGFNTIELLICANTAEDEKRILQQIEEGTTIKLFNQTIPHDRALYAVKTCKLRMPGVLMIDIFKPRNFLSVAEERKARLRNDDNNVHAECILVPAGKFETWQPLAEASVGISDSSLSLLDSASFQILVYKMTDNHADADLAMNLLDRLLDQGRIPSPIE